MQLPMQSITIIPLVKPPSHTSHNDFAGNRLSGRTSLPANDDAWFKIFRILRVMRGKKGRDV